MIDNITGQSKGYNVGWFLWSFFFEFLKSMFFLLLYVT